MENTHSNFEKAQTKDVPKFSFIALVMAALVFIITLLTAFIATPSFLNQLASTIILWNIPLIVIALLVYASVTEKRGSILRWITVVCMALSFFFTNPSKNTVQDYASNVDNFVDIAIATADNALDDIDEYETKIESAAKSLERKLERHYNSRYNRYDEEYY